MSTPVKGFHYFDSPESDNDEDILANTFLYCRVAVAKWKEYREDWLRRGAKPKVLDGIERNAIDVFREFGDTFQRAVDTNNLGLLSDLRLQERFLHAHAYLALYADPDGMPEYRDFIAAKPLDGAAIKVHDFCTALWEGDWNRVEGSMPSEITRKLAGRNALKTESDGKFNRHGRLDPVASAESISGKVESTQEYDPAPEPFTEDEERRAAQGLTTIGKRAGLQKLTLKALADCARGKKALSDNPSAARTIRDSTRKRQKLEQPIRDFIGTLRSEPRKPSK